MTNSTRWERFQQRYSEFPEIGLSVDLSRMNFSEEFIDKMTEPLRTAQEAMDALESGAIANPDENRMVGHYWLRAPELAPEPSIKQEIEATQKAIKEFAAQVHNGTVRGAEGPFRNLILIGIGGSALGPQFLAHALGMPEKDPLRLLFLDNTDPDGFDKVFAQVARDLGRTLCVVISKSGGTKETRNGMIETERFYESAGLDFAGHAVAITQPGSELSRYAEANGWLRQFPMWDWVGGRTSVMSAVGLLPAALQGIPIDSLLKGARLSDECTRQKGFHNPAAQLALMWYYAGNGRGEKAMVMLPYKDRLELFSRYLQQLVMESLGKEFDLSGQEVHQGLTVYGNKGSTDQHAFIQQLRDGLPNFFVTFIEVLRDRAEESIPVEPDVTSGDYLLGFLQGTKEALAEKNRESITLTVADVSPFSVGALVALYERAVGLYASLIQVNAYHQPGVEAGKKAAGSVLELQRQILSLLHSHPREGFTVEGIAAKLESKEQKERIFKICEHLAANTDRPIEKRSGSNPFDGEYASLK